ncbi:hypothetical protein P8452_00883 [Trifolium repens]|nr:hypothetical protein P8452_00883 [Trifolium repens]
MASSSFSDSSHGKACTLQYNKFICRCGKVADIKISGTDRNPQKLFYTCKGRVCGFGDWAHPIGCRCNFNEDEVNGDEVNAFGGVSNTVKAIETRLLAIERDVTTTSFVMCEIKSMIMYSKTLFFAMLFMVVVTFFIVLVK